MDDLEVRQTSKIVNYGPIELKFGTYMSWTAQNCMQNVIMFGKICSMKHTFTWKRLASITFSLITRINVRLTRVLNMKANNSCIHTLT